MSTGTVSQAEIVKCVEMVAQVLGISKISNYSACASKCKKALQAGFTFDDFYLASKAMLQADAKYHSMLSVFTKTDYWMAQAEEEKPLGVW